jgi:hypothetical protein
MSTIDNHINQDKKILDDPLVSAQSRRHLEQELESLEKYKQRHPDNDYDPTPFELYCDENPHALECRIYDN